MSMDLLRHALNVCDDPDCELHQVEVGFDEGTVTPASLAFFVAGAQAMELAIRRSFYLRRCDPEARADFRYACLVAGRAITRRAQVTAFGCDDCGAPAGRECYPEYGCRPTSRTVLV